MKPQGEKPDAGAERSRASQAPQEAVDDGRTVAPMDAEWMPWNAGGWMRGHSRAGRKRKQASAGVTFTPAERRAAVRGALLAHLPAIAGMALLGVLLYLLARLWLMPG